MTHAKRARESEVPREHSGETAKTIAADGWFAPRAVLQEIAERGRPGSRAGRP